MTDIITAMSDSIDDDTTAPLWADADAQERNLKFEALRAETRRYFAPVFTRILELNTQRLHDAFIAEYGADAEPLWPERLAVLDPVAPIRVNRVWHLFYSALNHGEPVVGRTLADLADSAYAHDTRIHYQDGGAFERVDVKEYGTLVVTEPGNTD